ncbi:hypothetical protein METBIDRAFT_78493 [Metschnikowia bicuspidata var. bicuspidata NRRL YB-4993]|uniref:Uncharacterized protein n=1 Tax=Metschnikowia bicuspidata var. bicuspidata NRRL YB-4993 TaxID=869754 RepID=A0A1A0HBQ6_9ASCO|nr:hypothetical protein METBIDRAFT_78493 [Metschnikowia bicuspidata var. bicuspidata NRRL YB-4993]OBA21569.1 hypothetical protein METBIDRAFT_78493 [Metschnikowia bicuspidata var. bicuspidata NRRL YB-4993]
MYASLERETNVHRAAKASVKIKPRISDFLIFLRRKQEHKIEQTTLRPLGLPLLYKEAVLIETVLFHILTCFHSSEADLAWIDTQADRLAFLHRHISERKKGAVSGTHFTTEDAHTLAQKLGFSILEQQHSVLVQALNLMSITCPSILKIDTLVPWIRSLCAARITEACAELTNLTEIPTCVSSDILLRTPLSIDEVALQLDLWQTFIVPIAQEYHERRTHVTSIIENLVFYTAQYEPRKLETFLQGTLSLLTSTRSGFTYKVMTNDFVNSLIYFLALTFIKNSAVSLASPMPSIKAQKILVEYLGNEKLSQKGYVGITLLISHESEDKATRLLDLTRTRFPEESEFVHYAKIYLSNTPEELLHTFNVAILQHPLSATMWLMLIKKLQQLHFLTEKRSQQMLLELLARKQNIIISKDVVLVLLSLIESISGIEDFIQALQKLDLFVKFQGIVLNKYMSLLYRYNNEKSVHKPYLDKFIHHTSNVECARYLYQRNAWKTTGIIGVMLHGEASHRPGDLYQLYCDELQGSVPDEACLSALLRASMKRVNGRPLLWGLLYAPQVAVHEFKQYVLSEPVAKDSNVWGIVASNRLWQVYIHALRSAEYTAELADIMRWWEEIEFVPSRSTLTLLLRALPPEFADRHIKHAHSLPRTSVSWPWPSIEEVRGH